MYDIEAERQARMILAWHMAMNEIFKGVKVGY